MATKSPIATKYIYLMSRGTVGLSSKFEWKR